MSLIRPIAATLAAALLAACPRPADGPRDPTSAGRGGARCATAGEDASRGTWEDGDVRAVVEVAGSGCERRFTMTTTSPLRDGRPDNPRVVRERAGAPSLHTGNPVVDGAHALALAEVRQASVARIHDAAMGDGEPLACPDGGCFETGRKWTYVWTRDTAYAVDLALAGLDPARARNSLAFKLSPRRSGGDEQIVQDTGSGGSYPVSTDRVVWALGARELVRALEGDARRAFAARAYRALANTLEHDRAVVFDEQDGLYRGETSFLDWREQTYPPFTAEDTVPIAASKALSTNVAHLRALEIAAELADRRGERDAAGRFRSWARDLRRAIADRFYLEDAAQFSSFIPGGLDPAPARRFDLLGTSLAVLAGVGTEAQRAAAIASYPVLPKGPPVVWPQQPDVPIYHNRAIWPFVTAYWIRAAREVENARAVALGVRSLVRGAALNLSHMENFEVVTGRPHVRDGDLSGPVVNSQRQLWSVAGFLSVVHRVIFGIEPTASGVRFRPFVPRELRNTLLSGAERIALNDVPVHGRRVTVILHLPPAGHEGGGAYAVDAVRVGGEPAPEGVVPSGALSDGTVVEVALSAETTAPARLTRLRAPAHEALFSPPAPRIDRVTSVDAGFEIAVSAEGEAPVTVAVYRDGRRIGTAEGETFVDRTASASGPSRCYAVEAAYAGTGTVSHRSRPVCAWGEANERARRIGVGDLERRGGALDREGDVPMITAWGEDGDRLTGRFVARSSGRHLVGVRYANAGPINTGVTCGVKRVTITDEATGEVAGAGYAVMPHTGTGDPVWRRSTLVAAELRAGRAYDVRIDEDRRSVNMADLRHFERYTGGAGGAGGPRNLVSIRAIEILAREAPPE